jgi:hypothetical protein
MNNIQTKTIKSCIIGDIYIKLVKTTINSSIDKYSCIIDDTKTIVKQSLGTNINTACNYFNNMLNCDKNNKNV